MELARRPSARMSTLSSCALPFESMCGSISPTVVEVNPSTAVNIKFALTEYFSLMRLRGYTPLGVTCERQRLYLSTDEGAKLNDSQADENIVHLLGAGHEEQAYIQRLCPMAFALRRDFLATVLGFTEKAAEIIVKNAKYLHKPYQIRRYLCCICGRW